MKDWYKSRTIWIAIIQAVIGITVAVTHEFQDAAWVGGALILKSALDMILRAITIEPLA